MPRPFASDREWSFPEPPDALWERIRAVDRYCHWWPWLRAFDPGTGLEPDARWHCEVAPPLPYVVRFTIDFDRVEHGRRAETTVDGDITGRAVLTLDELGDAGTRARLVSQLAPANPVLRTVGRMARPVVEWGHDWVLDQGRHQFVRHEFG
jgi:hypothetical protein